MTRLNLGCGDDIRPGYTNVDLYNDKADMKFDIRQLPFADNSVQEIVAYHVIEHFDVIEADAILAEWYRVLIKGGILLIETPDLWQSCKAFIEWPEEYRPMLYGHMFAKAWLPGETHKFLYTEDELGHKLQNVGFTEIYRTEPDSSYYKARDKWNPELYLHFRAVK